ncbi:Bifunctional epoxide hydrolase 2 [Hondaea fermentalgiana]|uniref:Bifunctional epoxide hydrolase 2 n=1 Tax=Hondaea fermentalgiana TaxID=2315210 RepID=A0A2R5G2G1_9STRA|nr:Bifunctional epoxide hydrolase 2 [Hondaea fermentalgiana]|eukprot:GBG25206.1 Bifunctional epoxide hydrolase 2 [Hondaea fermentalgiana]
MRAVHQMAPLRTGVDMHYVEALPPQTQRVRATVLCVHGFPDAWFGYRKQIPALAEAGYRVLVPDMRGYGATSVPREIEAYAMEEICKDIEALLDTLFIDKIVIVGHDWGGTCVWNFALHYPERILGLAAFCTPFFPWKPDNPWPRVKANENSRFNYQIWFQRAEAEQEFESDYGRAVRCMIRGTSQADIAATGEFATKPWRPTQDGGALANYPATVPRSEMLSEAEEHEYTQSFARSGFFGMLSWYRNVERNWVWNASTEGKKVNVPCLMVTAGRDATLPPSMTKHMPKWIDDLTQHNVPDAGHWVLQERPEACNKALLSWLDAKSSVIERSSQAKAHL